MSTKDSIIAIYVGYYDRAPDPDGLNYWINQVNGGMSLSAVAASFAVQTESTALYPYLDNPNVASATTFITSVYANLFNRTPDAEGLAYWEGQLTAAAGSPDAIGAMILNIINGAQGDDATTVANKKIVATDWVEKAAEIANFNYNTSAATSAKGVLDGVDATDASVTAGKAETTTFMSGAGSSNAGSTFALTANTDALEGTAGNDTFNGVLQKTGDEGTTVAPGDSINGGDGTDLLSISVAGDAGGAYTLSAIQTESVEKVLLSNFDTDATADGTVVDTALMNGLTTVGLSASSATGDTVFENMTALTNAEMSNGSADLKLTHSASTVSGTSDAISLAVSNVSAGTFTANSIETINVSTGSLVDSKLTAITSDALKSLTISGEKDLEIGTALDFASVGTKTDPGAVIDASAMTGSLTVTTEAADFISLKGGSGDDTFNVGALTKDEDVIDGGAGTDTVAITTHDGVTALKITDLGLTNVEKFSVEATNGKDASIDATGAALEKVIVIENDTTAKDVAVSGLAANATVELVQNVDGQDMGDVTLSLADPSGSADVLNIEVSGTSAQGAETIDSITVADVETINLKSSYTGSTATVATDSNVIDDQTYSGATTLNITGDTNLTLTNAATAAGLITIDASALTGKLDMTAHAADLTLTGGSNDDTFKFGATLTIADTVDGGANSTDTDGGDTLTATINALGTSASAAALKIANVENITFNTATAASYIDVTNITGASSIGVENDQSVTFSNAASGQVFQLGGTGTTTDDYSGTLTVSLADATGSADELTVKLADTDNDDDVNATLMVADTVEKLTIQASDDGTANDATLDVDKAEVATLALTGGNATELLTLGTVSTKTKTIDASAFDGLLSVTASTEGTSISVKQGAAGNAIVGGAGNDTITIADLADDDANGGAGTDILNATIDSNQTEATTNFETINYTIGNNKQVTLTGANGAGVDVATTFNLLGGNSLSTFANNFVSPGNLTTINMSGFGGKSTELTFAASQLVNTMTITGSAGDDTVVATTNSDNAAVSNMTGVETLDLNVAGADTAFDFSKTTGLTLVKLDDDGTARTATLTDLTAGTAIEVEHGENGSGVVIDLVNKTDSDNAVTLEMKKTASDAHTYNISGDDIETFNLKMSDASVLDLSGLQMTASGATSTLALSGDKVATISALNADITTIDASGMSAGGGVILSARSSTDVATYTGSVGNDTFIMANAGDVLTGGEGSDMLDIDFTSVLGGGIVIDLSSTGDQLTTFQSSANAAVQQGFENVDLSGYSSTSGAQITGSDEANTITGTSNADQINGGAGGDTITGGGGADNITGGDGNDDFVFTDNTTSNTITDFDAAGDEIDELHFDISALGLNAADYAAGASILADEDTILALASGAAANHIFLDTAANIDTFTNAGTEFSGAAIAIETDTGNIIYDADADFSAGSVIIGTITAAEAAALVAGNVDLIA